LIPLKDNLPSLRFPLLTVSLIAASVVLYIAGWDPDLGDTWWPLAAIASLFVSDGFWELAVNMLFLWLFAKSLEDTLGGPRFLVLFLLAGLAAAAAQELVDPETVVPSVGIAGAIAGLIGAYSLLYPRARILCWVLIPFFVTFSEIPALILASLWLVLQAVPAVGQPPLAGLVGGLLLGLAAARLLARGRTLISAEASQPVY
jgi:membrane associated rhomboid family serine protease